MTQEPNTTPAGGPIKNTPPPVPPAATPPATTPPATTPPAATPPAGLPTPPDPRKATPPPPKQPKVCGNCARFKPEIVEKKPTGLGTCTLPSLGEKGRPGVLGTRTCGEHKPR